MDMERRLRLPLCVFWGKEMPDMAKNIKKPLPDGISVRKDGRYQARYTFNGRRHTIYGKDLKEIQKKLRDVK